MFIFKKKDKLYREVVVKESTKCDWCKGVGKVLVTYDGDEHTCDVCNGKKVTDRIVKFVPYKETDSIHFYESKLIN